MVSIGTLLLVSGTLILFSNYFNEKLSNAYSYMNSLLLNEQEEIYDKIPKRKRTKVLEKTSDEWKKGFADGYAEVMAKLRKESLVEKCVTM